MYSNPASRGLSFGPGEFKTIDYSTYREPTTTGVVYLINGCARGSAFNQRNGQEILMRSIELRYHVVSQSVTLNSICRIAIVYDRQTNAALPAITDILNTADITSARNLENRKRFRILYDKTIPLSISNTNGSQHYEKFYRKLRHPVNFNTGTTGGSGDITTGSLLIVLDSDQALVADSPRVYYHTRVRFTDV